jgi:hypothetical protein
MKTSKQVQAPLLCDECEGRFSVGGEDWVLKNSWRSDTEFRLQKILFAAKPAFEISGDRAFPASTIGYVAADKLAYFAASVFWRAAVRRWEPIVGHVIPKLDLGPYEGQLRLFLLSKAAFPEEILLRVVVSSFTKPGENWFVHFPFFNMRKHTYRHYSFTVPGLRFDMMVGKGMPAGFRKMCLVHSVEHVVFTSPDADEANLAGAARLLAGSRRVRKKG